MKPKRRSDMSDQEKRIDEERRYALDAFRRGETVTYCAGPGCPVLKITTIEAWDEAVRLGPRARGTN